jgi:NADH-quinone oxidoreductase subunit C
MKDLGKVYKEQKEAIFVEVPLSKLEKTIKNIKHHGVQAVNAITSYDDGRELEVLYHFVYQGIVLTLKTRVRKELSAVPSIVDVFPSAMLFEQENHEMFGLTFSGNPKMRQLLLSKLSPKTPLRKGESTREVNNEKGNK